MANIDQFHEWVETQSPMALREYTFAQAAWIEQAIRIAELKARNKELEALAEQPTGQPTRLEVIDADGRTYTNWKVKEMEFSYQDDGRTLKIFIKESE
jgi:hypothetical protein